MNNSAFFRESGTGTSVICLHSNASSSSQWRELIDLLAPSYHVLAPDSYGSGKSPDWHSDRFISLSDEVDLLESVVARATGQFILVGHSYDAAVALLSALRWRERVQALILYEPTLFSLVEAMQPSPNGVDGIRDAVASASAALDQGDGDAAAQHFIDFWMGPGAWKATPESRKPSIADSVANVRRWGHALFTEPTQLNAFAELNCPILYLIGDRSPESAHAVAGVLTSALPKVESVIMPKMGHMAPITHASAVNEQIKLFLERHK